MPVGPLAVHYRAGLAGYALRQDTTACQIVGPDMAIRGNLDPVRGLSRGTPESVMLEANRVLAAMHAARHSRFVLRSGCTLAVETPPQNLEALIAAGRTPGFGVPVLSIRTRWVGVAPGVTWAR
ncbi:MAG: hypothetical protein NTW21_00680 [Verrucomicrobia bacterium]|nr:hypothetical protein [Verrucomicrobiota bacterium]